jgi:hypothetical protein
MQSQIESQVEAMSAEKMKSEQTQKTNLEEKSEHRHHRSKKHHKKARKGHQQHAHSLMMTSMSTSGSPAAVTTTTTVTPAANTTSKPTPKPAAATTTAASSGLHQARPAPAAKHLINTKAQSQDQFDKFAQNVDVPIDEVKAITMKVSPTFTRDRIESVTLKSFRKVVGYDTFDSILKGDRSEKKDISDHYNITVSMMVRREPVVAPVATESLASKLDKGFPYDDGDNTIEDAAQMYVNKGPKDPSAANFVGKLNGENITKDALVNLVMDTEVPLTQ